MRVRRLDGAGKDSSQEHLSPVTRRGVCRAERIAEPSEPEEVRLTATA
jgi:hypothetical protein